MVKTASAMLDSATITFLRFSIGVLFLGGFLLFTKRSVKLRFDLTWIWFGAIGKCCNYFFENMALSIGYSYGNIIVPPIQTLILLVVSVIWLKERMTVRAWVAALLCVAGVFLIGWNGLPLSALIQGGAQTTLLYAISAVGAAFHVLSQRMLIKQMDAGAMNYSVFFWCSVLTLIPLPFQFAWPGHIGVAAVLSMILLGVITGFSFYWFALALRQVSFPVAVIVGNCPVLFSILWAAVFFGDPITVYIIGGAVAIVAGLLLLNLPVRSEVPAVAKQGVADEAGR